MSKDTTKKGKSGTEHRGMEKRAVVDDPKEKEAAAKAKADIEKSKGG